VARGSPALDLSTIPIVDQHAHNLLDPKRVDTEAFQAAFTEAYDHEIVRHQVGDTLFFRRSLRDLGRLFDCAPDLDAVLAARERLGFESSARRCFAAGGVERVLFDDGFMADEVLPITWHERLTRPYRLLRVERLAEELIAATEHWDAFRERLFMTLEHPPAPVVGLKSIVAYRTGLAIQSPDDATAAADYATLREQLARGGADAESRYADRGEIRSAPPLPRLASKPLNDWVVWQMLEAASRNGLPVQLHTGFGDPDLDLRVADPLHLRPLLKHDAFHRVRFVLLHGSYPFTRNAGYLAAVYPNVYVDFGLAIPTLSVAGMRSVVQMLLELAPVSKVLYSSDAHVVPELFYLGALWGRRILAGELERSVADGDLTVEEAERVGEMMLHDTAVELYGLGR
jgi:predicted TIM-barrel fold metal-dependent hydrolase